MTNPHRKLVDLARLCVVMSALLAVLVYPPRTLAQDTDAPAEPPTSDEPAAVDEPATTDDAPAALVDAPADEPTIDSDMPVRGVLLDEKMAIDNQADKSKLDDLPDFGSALIRMVIVLVVLIVLMLVLAKLVPRWLSRRSPVAGKRMRVVDRMRVEPGRSLLVVHVGGQYLLMASDSEGLRVVAQDAIDQDALRAAFDGDNAEAQTNGAPFSTLLNASRSVGGGASAETPGKEAV